MTPFATAMALLWLGAEMFILVVVRWGARAAEDLAMGKPAPPFGVDRFARVLGGLFVAVALGLIVSRTAAQEALAGHPRGPWLFDLTFGLVWNALCMAWVWLEGAIALYVLRIDGILHARAANRVVPPRPPAHQLWLSLLWPSFAVAYNALAVASAFRQDFSGAQLEGVLLFFLRFCGAGWIVFELVVARSGVRLVRLLGRR
jgi:hypothetical protein